MFVAVREQIDTIFKEDPAAKSVVEIVLCYPGFHAILVHRLSHKLYTAGFQLVARFLSQAVRFWTGIEIHPGANASGRRSLSTTGQEWSSERQRRSATMS